jgi:hypothetical protein
MYQLMKNLPDIGTLGVVAVIALLAGPLGRLPIDLGAWLLDMLVRRILHREPGLTRVAHCRRRSSGRNLGEMGTATRR